MAIPHAAPAELIDFAPPPLPASEADSELLVRTTHLEVFRYVLPAGKAVQEHSAAGLMVVQCLAGAVDFSALGRTQRMHAGSMLWLPDGEPHALTACEDSTLLVTILLNRA
jgi:quercetin dioxygenase-like cupin family protein